MRKKPWRKCPLQSSWKLRAEAGKVNTSVPFRAPSTFYTLITVAAIAVLDAYSKVAGIADLWQLHGAPAFQDEEIIFQ